jgi:hypothetical protein
MRMESRKNMTKNIVALRNFAKRPKETKYGSLNNGRHKYKNKDSINHGNLRRKGAIKIRRYKDVLCEKKLNINRYLKSFRRVRKISKSDH